MSEIDPTKLGPNELFISGLLQVDTAITVLETTGINPDAYDTLVAMRNAYLSLTPETHTANDFSIYMSEGKVGAMKADIIASAMLTESNSALPEERRTAARGLLEVLGISI